MKRFLARLGTDVVGLLIVLVCAAALAYLLWHLPALVEWAYPNNKPTPNVEWN